MSNVNEQMLQSGFAAGGVKQDPVSGNEVPVGSLPHEVRDDVDAKLSEGEFVLPADVVRFIGLQKLMQLRDKAKEGLARMAEMGQMGNSDEAKANGENPLGSFGEGEEDDDGFEAEIDDIMGSGGEVEMAVGGAVPSNNPYAGMNLNWNAYTPGKGWSAPGGMFQTRKGENPAVLDFLQKNGWGSNSYDVNSSWLPGNTMLGENSAISADERNRLESLFERSMSDADPLSDSEWKEFNSLQSKANQFNINRDLDKVLNENGWSIQSAYIDGETPREIVKLVDRNGNVLAHDDYTEKYRSEKNTQAAALALVAAGVGAGLSGVEGLGNVPTVGAGSTASAMTGGASSIGTGLGGAVGGVGGGGTGNIKYLDPNMAGPKPVLQSQNITAADIGFGSMDAAGKYTAGLTGGTGVTGAVPSLSSPNLLDQAKEYVTNKLTDPKEIAKTVGKEVVKDVTGGGSKGSASSIPPWLIGAGLGAAAGSAIGGGGSSSSTPSSKTEVPRGNNPVVDYRPIDSQTEELFINNRPTGKKKKRGFAVGGDVGSEINLDAYNFFNQKD